MLIHTFCHLPGIGPKTERKLWRGGILSWDQYPQPNWNDGLTNQLGHKNKNGWSAGGRELFFRELLDESARRLDAGDPLYFAKHLPSPEHWRIFSDFRQTTAYLDIETNGLMGPGGYITAITVYDGTEIKCFVHGQNLDDFPGEIEPYRVLVTYNGKCFDLPFIEKYFGIRLRKAHIDLRYILSGLGFRGGLKGCEKSFGIDRGDLDGVDGFFAVLLWEEYKRRRDEKALITLLAYNILDTVNLERLMVEAYNMKVRLTPFGEERTLTIPQQPALPYEPDHATVEKVLRKYILLRD